MGPFGLELIMLPEVECVSDSNYVKHIHSLARRACIGNEATRGWSLAVMAVPFGTGR